jgi:hypothetical protein
VHQLSFRSLMARRPSRSRTCDWKRASSLDRLGSARGGRGGILFSSCRDRRKSSHSHTLPWCQDSNGETVLGTGSLWPCSETDYCPSGRTEEDQRSFR